MTSNELQASAPKVGPVAEFLGWALYEFDAVKPLLPMYGHLIISALFSIIAGAHASLTRPSSAAKAPKRSNQDDTDGEDDEVEDEPGLSPIQKVAGFSPMDAVLFPVMAGLTLGGLYVVIKWLEDPAVLNSILTFYFSLMGLSFATAFLKDALSVIRSFAFPTKYQRAGRVWIVKQSQQVFTSTEKVSDSPLAGSLGRVPLPKSMLRVLWGIRGSFYQRLSLRAYIRGVMDINFLFDLLDVVSGVTSLAAVGYFAAVAKPWWLTNFLGFSFCYNALQFMSPTTFTTGTLILGALFVYDIYFVFFTPLMVTVAKNLDIPVKLLFPRPPKSPSETYSLSMLGLGDIVIPGMMVALALRFDLFLYYRRKGIQKALAEGSKEAFVNPYYQSATGGWGERFWTRPTPPAQAELERPYSDARTFPKKYFYASTVGYTVGMIGTLLGMHYSGHPQPALLYLVPGVVLSLWGTALFSGDMRDAWEFVDSEEDEEEKKKEDGNGKQEEEKEKTKTETARGLLLRLLSGDTTVFNLGTSNKSRSEEEKEDKDQTEKKSEDNKGSDLFVISISFPRKKSNQATSKSATNGVDESVPSFTSAQGKDEPPRKRLRKSFIENGEDS